MTSLVQYVKYDAINTTETSTMGYYVIKFVLEAYTLQEDSIRNGQIISSSEIVVKAQYIMIEYRLVYGTRVLYD